MLKIYGGGGSFEEFSTLNDFNRVLKCIIF